MTKTESHRHNIKLLNLSINYYALNTVHWCLFAQLNDYTALYFMADKERIYRIKRRRKKLRKQIKQQKMRTGLGTTHTICHRVRNGVRNYTDTWWKSENDVIGWDTTKWHHHIFIYTYSISEELGSCERNRELKYRTDPLWTQCFGPIHHTPYIS